MVDSADLQVSASTVGSCSGRKKELLDLQLSSVYAGGHLKKVLPLQAQEHLHDLIERVLCVYQTSFGMETKC